jgi:hypothetical protein
MLEADHERCLRLVAKEELRSMIQSDFAVRVSPAADKIPEGALLTCLNPQDVGAGHGHGK